MNYRHELQNTGNNSCVSCLGWRWHLKSLNINLYYYNYFIKQIVPVLDYTLIKVINSTLLFLPSFFMS